MPGRGSAYGRIEPGVVCETELNPCPLGGGDVACRGRAGRLGGSEHVYRQAWMNGGDGALGKFADRDCFLRADIVGAGVRAAQQHGPEPHGEVGGIQVGSQRCAIATDGDRAPSECIAEKVAGGVVCVERKVRAENGKGPCDNAVQIVLSGAEFFRGSLPCRVGAPVGGEGVLFRDVGERAGLLPVNCARADEQETLGTGLARDVKCVRSALHDGRGEFVRISLRRANAVRGSVDHVVNVPAWKAEVADIALDKAQGRVGRKVRRALAKDLWRARKDPKGDAEVRASIELEQALNKPGAEKTCSAGEKNAAPRDHGREVDRLLVESFTIF